MPSQSTKPTVRVLAPAVSRDPVSLLHRVESCMIASELKAMGYGVSVSVYKNPQALNEMHGIKLLRLSDALMVQATRELTDVGVEYAGPSAAVLEQCYDKLLAYRRAEQGGILCPATFAVVDFTDDGSPLILKPRRGSDSLGIRICRNGLVPSNRRTSDYLVQPFIEGAEVTVGLLKRTVGVPLEILRPEGKVYSFFRKNVLRTERKLIDDIELGKRIHEIAVRVAEVFEVDWAARVDFLYDRRSDRLYFLECDAAPTISKSSSFAQSLERSGLTRQDKIELLLGY